MLTRVSYPISEIVNSASVTLGLAKGMMKKDSTQECMEGEVPEGELSSFQTEKPLFRSIERENKLLMLGNRQKRIKQFQNFHLKATNFL